MLFNLSNRFRNLGLLFLRVGMGGMFMFHGAPKLFGGPEVWEKVGMAMGSVGITFLPVFWGFMAAISEFFGGFFLVLGLFVRPACLLLTITMGVATMMHLGKGDGLKGASHALEAAIVFASLFLIGPGSHSIDERLSRKE